MKTLREMTWAEAEPIYRAFHAGEPLETSYKRGNMESCTVWRPGYEPEDSR